MTEAEAETEGSARQPAPQAAVTSAMSSDPGHEQESFPVSTLGQADGSPGQGLVVPPPLCSSH